MRKDGRIHRESSRSGRWSSKATRDLSWAHCRCCRLFSLSLFLPLFPSYSFFPSALPGLFIPFSVAGSLSSSTSSSSSSSFLSFCPFSASANDSRLFIPRLCIARGTERGCFCVCAATAERACCYCLYFSLVSTLFRISNVAFVTLSSQNTSQEKKKSAQCLPKFRKREREMIRRSMSKRHRYLASFLAGSRFEISKDIARSLGMTLDLFFFFIPKEEEEEKFSGRHDERRVTTSG